MKGREVTSQITQRTVWISVEMGMMKLGALETIKHLTILAVIVIFKAITTEMTLTNTVETVPNDFCCKMKMVVLIWPKKSKEQRKR